MTKEKKQKTQLMKILTIFIVTIIILSLFFGLYVVGLLGKIEAGSLIPTGNVDIFDVKLNCECAKCPTCVCPNVPVVRPPKPDDTHEETSSFIDDGKLTVFDKDDVVFTASEPAKLRIFENTAYSLEDKIAPGVSNLYQFIIRNANDFNIKYSIEMVETNSSNINMKYRLKKDNVYVSGSDNVWVNASELNVNGVQLATKSMSVYSLEWKWFDSENDTSIGKEVTNYSLGINVIATELD